MELSEQAQHLERELAEADRRLSQMRGQATAVAEAGRRSKAEAGEQLALACVMEEACGVLRRYADVQQEDIRRRLEGLVTLGLRAVFEEDLAFHLRSKVVGKRTDTELTITSTYDGQQIETPIMDARGGGVAAVTGFLLQVILLLLHRAPKILFLDEAFSQVSAEYEPRLVEFMSELADRSGMQFVVVTHSSAFEDVSDAVYRTSSIDGATKVERVK